MRAAIYAVIMTAGGIFGLGEIVSAKYLTGTKAGELVLYERSGATAQSQPLTVRAEDLPIRINMDVYGKRRSLGNFQFLRLRVETGLGDSKTVEVNISKKRDVGISNLSIGNLRIGPYSYNNWAQPDIIIEDAKPGIWRISAKPVYETEYEAGVVTGTVYFNARKIDWWIAGAGGAAYFFGMIFLIAVVKARQSAEGESA
jgi:hypothetical protein